MSCIFSYCAWTSYFLPSTGVVLSRLNFDRALIGISRSHLFKNNCCESDAQASIVNSFLVWIWSSGLCFFKPSKFRAMIGQCIILVFSMWIKTFWTALWELWMGLSWWLRFSQKKKKLSAEKRLIPVIRELRHLILIKWIEILFLIEITAFPSRPTMSRGPNNS